jgi:phage terminase small subunit
MTRKRKRKQSQYLPKSKAKAPNYIPPEAQGLSEKQRRFCEEYIVDLNRKAACLRAGYAKATAGTKAYQLWQKPEVRRYVHHLKTKRAKNLKIDQDRVAKEFARIAFQDQRTFYSHDNQPVPLHDLTDDQAACVKTLHFENYREPNPDYNPKTDDEPKELIKKRIKKYTLHNKVEALRMLGHHIGMSLDKPADAPPLKPTGEDVDFKTLLSKLKVAELEKLMDILATVQTPQNVEKFPEDDEFEQATIH